MLILKYLPGTLHSESVNKPEILSLKIFSRYLAFQLGLMLSLPVLADRYEDGGAAYEAGNNVEAMAIWRPLAEEGDLRAQYAIANLYREGLGVEQDLRRAAYWMEQAAGEGFALAQFNLGNAYREGYGVRQDDSAAVNWWRLAAGQGNSDAMYNLGIHYYYGRGVSQNKKSAYDWFVKAAEGGNEQAQRVVRVEPMADSGGSTAITVESTVSTEPTLVLPDFAPPDTIAR